MWISGEIFYGKFMLDRDQKFVKLTRAAIGILLAVTLI